MTKVWIVMMGELNPWESEGEPVYDWWVDTVHRSKKSAENWIAESKTNPDVMKNQFTIVEEEIFNYD